MNSFKLTYSLCVQNTSHQEHFPSGTPHIRNILNLEHFTIWKLWNTLQLEHFGPLPFLNLVEVNQIITFWTSTGLSEVRVWTSWGTPLPIWEWSLLYFILMWGSVTFGPSQFLNLIEVKQIITFYMTLNLNRTEWGQSLNISRNIIAYLRMCFILLWGSRTFGPSQFLTLVEVNQIIPFYLPHEFI